MESGQANGHALTCPVDMSDSTSAETRSATIVRRPNGLVETRFRQEALIDEEGIRENIRTRRQLCADEPHALLTVVPSDVQFATAVMSPDLFPSKDVGYTSRPSPSSQRMAFRVWGGAAYFSCLRRLLPRGCQGELRLSTGWRQHSLVSASSSRTTRPLPGDQRSMEPWAGRFGRVSIDHLARQMIDRSRCHDRNPHWLTSPNGPVLIETHFKPM